MPDPLLKWPGGKRKLLPVLNRLITVDEEWVTEPFAGAAALSLTGRFRVARLADSCRPLRNFYKVIRHEVYLREMLKVLDSLPKTLESKEQYNEVRARFNESLDGGPEPWVRAALFLWLNKSCFNGLVRFSKSGGFNSPAGTLGRKVPLPSHEHLWEAQKFFNKRLSPVVYEHYGRAILDSHYDWWSGQKSQVIYLDPPYQPRKPGGFTGYSADGWGEEDLRWLAYSVSASDRAQEVPTLASDHAVEPALRVWHEAGFKVVWSGGVRRSINRDGDGRGKVGECIWANDAAIERYGLTPCDAHAQHSG